MNNSPLSKTVFHYSLLISSAVLYGLAYLDPWYWWWTTTIFLIPFFYRVLAYKLTLWDGAIWAVLLFTLNLFGVLEGLFLMAEGSFLMRLGGALVVLGAACLYGVLWFFLSTRLASYASQKPLQLVVWTISTCSFFLFLEHYSLLILGACEGYVLFNPLITLVEVPGLLYFLPIVGCHLLVVLSIVTQALGAAALFWGRWWWALASGTIIFWMSGILLSYLSVSEPFAHHTIVCGNAYFRAHDQVRHTGTVIRDYCKQLLAHYPEAECILFPETAIRCPLLPGEADILALLNHRLLGKPVTILTGGYRWDHGIYRNTLYWIHDGVLVDLFDKRHAMAFTERVPEQSFLGNNKFIKQVFFKKFSGVVPNSGRRPVWHIANNLTIVPYICSELFFNTYPDHTMMPGALLIAHCNDHWLAQESMRYQMTLVARYRALQWQVPILYVAHAYQVWCLPSGLYGPLPLFDHSQYRPA